ncbi:MAG: tripartite tricarboxylate transporter substrate-binding protein [Pigmentiphaga sp.]|uniref:Bug family tripartite tricarboxylate transporter substrate binding protein n=1 Tax=Pigmentiphaga sp. TaxID=1977564 RepID=UPI0029A5357F|nr:tripartite tricarboxylate transporter substrate-binding protein [Pigmentiphaga sp.]MDX3907471.1 tripartite tricarboxylate transporter substrate-binding protein [Pigmentiphaga sp.]
MKKFLIGLVLAVLAAPLTQAGAASDYPSRPIRWIVPFTAGGPADVIARLVAPKISAELGQPIVIENRAGADSNIGHEAAARATPDGYTILYVVPNLVTNPSLYKAAVDPIKELAPVSQLTAQSYLLLAGADFKAKSVADIIARAKDRGVTCASGGGLPGFGCEWLRSMTKADFVHVPFKGNAPALTALMGGQVDILIDLFNTALPQVKAGRVQPVALTRAERGNPLPDLPVIAETLPGFVLVGWHGVMAPAGTPEAVIRKLNAAFGKALEDPDVRRRISDSYIEVAHGSPEAFGRILEEDLRKYAQITQAAGIQKQ